MLGCRASKYRGPWGPGSVEIALFIYLFIYLFFVVPGIGPRGVLPPSYTPGPIFILHIETGSHELAEGLTK